MKNTSKDHVRLPFIVHLGLTLCAAAAASCAGHGDPAPEEAVRSTAAAAVAAPTLNTFITDSLEIDHLTNDPLNAADANLFKGNDPADGTASRQVPTGGPATFIDWNDLGNDLANHQLLDLNNSSGKDPSSFPLSNECVGTSSVLSKMDLTYIASANNNAFAYFAVQRANNNGDAGYYWLFTRKTPHQNQGESPCKSNQSRLTYDISGPVGGVGGDILLAGHFHPNGSPLLRIFRAKTDSNGVTAVNAIDFTNSNLWAEDSATATVAVNTTITAPGSFGSAGVLALTSTGNLEPEIFAEAAVPISVFTGGASACGATFFGSVITRSSGSGGTSPDLKDLAGPALFNFGSISAQPKLTGSCSLELDYDVIVTAGDGSTIPSTDPSLTCTWDFGDGTTATGACKGTHTVAQAGTYNVTVSVTQTSSTCSAGPVSSPVDVLAPISFTLAGSPASSTCPSLTDDSGTFSATVSGGKPPYSFAWTGCTSTSSQCTLNPADNQFCANQKVSLAVTDSSGGLCAAPPAKSFNYSKVTTVTVTAAP